MRLEYICIFRLSTGAEALSARSNESSLSLHFIGNKLYSFVACVILLCKQCILQLSCNFSEHLILHNSGGYISVMALILC